MENTCISLIERVHRRFLEYPLIYGHGTDNAWDEAVCLVTGSAGLEDDQESLLLPISNAKVDQVLLLAKSRVEDRIPLPYLMGFCSYAGYRFNIEPGVVIPRSPIGHLLVDGDLAAWHQREVLRVLDLCSGSGCLGILAALTYPGAEVVLLEKEPAAVDISRANIALHGLDCRVKVMVADVTRELQHELGAFDLILSNPPYVDQTDMGSLSEEFQKEPVEGLDGGTDGLAVVSRIMEKIPKLLSAEGIFVCEVGGSSAAFLSSCEGMEVLRLDLPKGGEGVFLFEAKSFHATS